MGEPQLRVSQRLVRSATAPTHQRPHPASRKQRLRLARCGVPLTRGSFVCRCDGRSPIGADWPVEILDLLFPCEHQRDIELALELVIGRA